MDIQIPEMDRVEATRLIRPREREDSSRTAKPTLAVTAHARAEDHLECLNHGMYGYI